MSVFCYKYCIIVSLPFCLYKTIYAKKIFPLSNAQTKNNFVPSQNVIITKADVQYDIGITQNLHYTNTIRAQGVYYEIRKVKRL